MTRFRGFLFASALLAAVAFPDSSTAAVNAQPSPAWTKTFGGSAGNSAAVDRDGNVYVTGGSGANAVVVRVNADGSTAWVKTLAGTANAYALGNAVAVDSQGNTYVLGEFRGTVDFDPGLGEDMITSNTTMVDPYAPLRYADVFLIRINADGSYGWTKKLAGRNIPYPERSVAVDADGTSMSQGCLVVQQISILVRVRILLRGMDDI